jgi:hypothetical protein
MFFGKKKKTPLLHTPEPATVGFSFADVPAPPKQKAFVSVGPAREKGEKKSTAAASSAKSSSASPTATRSPAKSKPKPRPEA